MYVSRFFFINVWKYVRYSTIEKIYITGFFFSMSRNTEKESRYIQYWQLLLFSQKKKTNKEKIRQKDKQ